MVQTKVSAGLLMYRMQNGILQILLAHPGGPYFETKDEGAWTIPKGLIEAGEDPLAAARREFQEETGIVPDGPFIPLSPVKQKGGKLVHAWAFEGDCDPASHVCNTFKMEWPPRSGQWSSFPEVDRTEFFDTAEARRKVNPAQIALIEELESFLESAD